MSRLVRANQTDMSTSTEIVSGDKTLCVLLNGSNWVPLPLLEVKVDWSVKNLFRFCRPQEYLAMKNYMTGDLSITSLKLELPNFRDVNAWKETANVSISDQVKHYIPIVDLVMSPRFFQSQMAMRLLPLTSLEEERESRACESQRA